MGVIDGKIINYAQKPKRDLHGPGRACKWLGIALRAAPTKRGPGARVEQIDVLFISALSIENRRGRTGERRIVW